MQNIPALFGFGRCASRHNTGLPACLQPHGIVQGLLRLVMRSFLVNRGYKQYERKRLIVRRVQEDILRWLQHSQKFQVA
jgi:hypothetical protein